MSTTLQKVEDLEKRVQELERMMDIINHPIPTTESPPMVERWEIPLPKKGRGKA